MLILLLVTVPIVLVLVLFGGKIVDEFQVGTCNLGIGDPPRWFMVERGYASFDAVTGGYHVLPEHADEDWPADYCALYRLAPGEGEGDDSRPHPDSGVYNEE